MQISCPHKLTHTHTKVVVRVKDVSSICECQGRARRMNSQYCVLDDLQGGCVRKENENLANEALMQQAVEHVQKMMEDNPNDFRKSMLERQQSQVLARKLAMGATVTKREQAGFSTKVYYLRCRKCREKVFTSYDIRQIGQGSHTLTDDHLRGKWAKTRELPIPQQWTMNMERVAGVCCKSCGHKWGSLARYIPSGNEYPILKLEHFILEDVATGTEISRKMKWSDRLFSVRELTEEEKGKL